MGPLLWIFRADLPELPPSLTGVLQVLGQDNLFVLTMVLPVQNSLGQNWFSGRVRLTA